MFSFVLGGIVLVQQGLGLFNKVCDEIIANRSLERVAKGEVAQHDIDLSVALTTDELMALERCGGLDILNNGKRKRERMQKAAHFAKGA